MQSLFKISGRKSLFFYSMLVGVLSGLCAIVFSRLLAYSEYWALERFAGLAIKYPSGEFHIEHNHQYLYNPYILFMLPILGGLFSGLVTHFFCKEAAGAGMDATINAFHNNEGRIDSKIPLIKSIATIFTLASGGSGGKEGPIAQIGAGFGSLLAGFLNAGARARRTLLLAGTAGGLGAIFHSPLGGALTAVESVYKEDIESDSLIPCIISSVTAYLIYSYVSGFHSIYTIQDVSFNSFSGILFYLLLGVMAYIMGALFIKIFQVVRNFFKDLKVKDYLKPAIGAIPVSVIGLFYPEVIGTGAGFLQDIIINEGNLLGQNLYIIISMFFLFGLLKVITTSFTIGSGGSAGIFVPSLFVGCMLGGSVGILAKSILPDENISVASFMLVGMGAFYSGVASAPIAGMVMVCEMIGSYKLLPPLMLVTIITFLMSGKKISIYKSQVENRFISPAHYWDMNLDVLDRTKIKDAFPEPRNIAIVNKNMLLAELEELAPEIQASDFIVTDEQGNYFGVMSLRKNRLNSDIRTFARTLITVEDVTEKDIPGIENSEPLSKSLQYMVNFDLDKIAILEKGKLLGYVRLSEVIQSYYKSTSKKI